MKTGLKIAFAVIVMPVLSGCGTLQAADNCNRHIAGVLLLPLCIAIEQAR